MRSLEARRVAVIGGIRIPFCRAHTAYARCSNQDMMTAVLRALVARYSLAGERLGDVSLGAVIKHSRDFNLARESTLSSGLAPETPAFDIQRACGTSLSAAIIIGSKISTGLIDAGIAGGTDSISDVPLVYPEAYRTHAARERTRPLARRAPHAVAQAAAEALQARVSGRDRAAHEALDGREHGDHGQGMAPHARGARPRSRSRAIRTPRARTREGFYDDLVVEFQGVKRDNNIRPDTSLEQLAKLKPVFDRGPGGTLTAGNSTPLTDGASAVLLSSEDWAKSRGLPIAAYLTHSREAAVDFVAKEGLLMAPAYAVSAMLAEANLALQDFDFYEIHEAFAAQTLATLKAWESEQFCRERLGRERALGADRSQQAQRQRRQRRRRPSVRGHGHAHRRDAREAVAQNAARARLDLRLHGGRHGRHGDTRGRVAPIPRCAASSVGVAGARDRAGRRVAPGLLVVRHHLRRKLGELLLPVRGARMRAQELRRPARLTRCPSSAIG